MEKGNSIGQCTVDCSSREPACKRTLTFKELSLKTKKIREEKHHMMVTTLKYRKGTNG